MYEHKFYDMRKLIILLSLFVISVGVFGQQSPSLFYAIDGSTWVSKYDRDKKEQLLWEKIELDLQAALRNGRLGEGARAKEDCDIFQRLFSLCKESFSAIRLADLGKEDLQNAEFRFFLAQNGVTTKNGIARNEERFNMEEFSECFDAVLREYSFNAKVVEDLANPQGGEYNLNFVLDDFAERMELVLDKIERSKIHVELKMKTISSLAPVYRAAKEKQQRFELKQNRRN